MGRDFLSSLAVVYMTVVAFSRSLKKSDVWLQDRLRSVVVCQGQRRKLWAEARSGKLKRNRMLASPFSSVELLSSVANKIQIFLLNLRFN